MVGVADGPKDVDGLDDVDGATVGEQESGGLALSVHTCS